MENPFKALASLGFGEYEAQAYVALLQHNPINGYELAKVSNVPRPNIYAVLQRLEEKGAVLKLETPAGVRYAPTPPAELLERLGSRFADSLTAAQSALTSLSAGLDPEYVWNVHGYATLLEHARLVAGMAKEELLVGLWPQEAQQLTQDLSRAEGRGAEMTTLCMAACSPKCGYCRGAVYPYRIGAEAEGRWLVVVADDQEALAAEVSGFQEGNAVRTRNRLLVEMTSGYLRNTIAAATLIGDLGPAVEGALSPAAKETLARLGPRKHAKGWLGYAAALFPSRDDAAGT